MILLVIIALIVLAEFLKVKVHKNDVKNTIVMSLGALLVSLEFYR